MALTLWVITDGRLGHLNQLKGLAQRLAAHVDTRVHYWDISKQRFGYGGRGGLKAGFASAALPDLVIGAGRRTQWPLLWTRWITRAPTIVLMRPSVAPLWLFSGACIPAHDNPPSRSTILITQGVMNNIEPVTSGRDNRSGLILLGGLNRHFDWSSPAVVRQVAEIVRAAPEINWLISDSPRTPGDCLPALAELGLTNVQLLPYRDTGPGWLPQQLASTGRVWVTCDSVSMVFESITSAAPTGLIGLPPLRRSRVVNSMAGVVDAGLAPLWCGENTGLPSVAQRLWEAERAALWLLEHFVETAKRD